MVCAETQQIASFGIVQRLIFPVLTLLSSLSLASSAFAASEEATTPIVCPAELESQIEQIISQPEFARSRWGVLVSALNSAEVLYRHDAEKYFIPASNVKLLTTAAVLHRLGPDFRIRTAIYGNGTQFSIVGRGDPSLTDTQLQQLTQQLQQQGIRQISQLIGDDSYFQDSPINPTWEWEDVQAGYGAPINSLILNQNAIGFSLSAQALGEPLRLVWDNPQEGKQWQIENQSVSVATTETEFIQVGRDLNDPILRVSGQLQVGSDPESTSVAVTNPGNRFLQRFHEILQDAGIAVQETAIISRETLPNSRLFAFVDSPPLSELLVEANQWSNNFYTEALLRIVGVGQPDSLAVVQEILTQLGVASESYQLADASGLSRRNLVSPEAIVQTLQAMARSQYASIYRNSLAVAGERGTLRNRFRTSPAAGNLWGKTGSLNGVMALSGYLEMPDAEPLVFSIMVNHSTQPDATVRQAMDEIVLTLTRLHRCSK